MEDSLKRLKALRRTSEVAIASSQQGSVSDDDKIRMQLKLDVNFYGKEVIIVDWQLIDGSNTVVVMSLKPVQIRKAHTIY